MEEKRNGKGWNRQGWKTKQRNGKVWNKEGWKDGRLGNRENKLMNYEHVT